MPTNKLQLLPIEWLQRGAYQPRKTFDPKGLKNLAMSIKAQGLLEPLIVRQLTQQSYEIIAGERRWRAAMIAGISELPCLIGEYTNIDAAAITLIENIQREDLTLLEEAHGYQQLVDSFHFHQEEVAALIGKSRSHVANILRLLTLCPQVQDLLQSNQLSLGHARLLVGQPTSQQIELAKLVVTRQLSVRKLEQLIQALKARPKQALPQPNSEHLRLQTHLAEQIGAPVEITQEGQHGGWLKIKYYDNDTLSGLLERFGLEYE